MVKISIASTTDVHGYTDEGLAQLRTHTSDLLIDNGDFFIGSPFATYGYAQHSISPLVDVANEIGYDVMVPGNHDLDFGLDWLLTQVKVLAADYVCCNLFLPDMTQPFMPYTIKEIKGQKVAVIGLLTGAYNQLAVSDSLSLEVIVEDPMKALFKVMDEVKNKADLIVVAYHGGLTNDPKTGAVWSYPSKEDEAYQIMEQFPEIDSLICGHQHFVNAAIHHNNIALVQAGTQARVLGYQEFEVASNNVSIIDNRIIPLEAKEYSLASRQQFQHWLESPVNLDKVADYITTTYPADLHLLNYTATTLHDLISETQGPFPLAYYFLSGQELAELTDLKDILDESGNYRVVASPGILPEYRVRQELLIPLFGEIVKYQAF